MAGRNTVEILLSAKDQASAAIRSTFGTLDSASSRAMGAVKAGAALAVSAMAAVGAAVAKIGVDYNAMMEQSEIAWSTILGSQEEAKKTLKELQTLGAKTPYEFEGLDKSAKLLQMAGFQGKDLFSTLTKVGDAVAAIGGNDEVLQGVSMALFQMSSKGKVSAEEMNQLAERGIPAWQMLADGMGKSVPELMKMSEQGKLFAKDAVPLMVDAMGNKFGGAMDKQSKTFNGMMSTMWDNLKILSAELSKPLFDGLKKGLEAALPLIDGLISLAKGNFKDFSETMKNAFGEETGGKIVAFTQKVATGMQQVKEWMDKGKEAIKAVFAIFTGNEGGGISMLARLGLSPEIISTVVSTVQGIKDAIFGFIQGYIGYMKNLFSGDGNVGQSFVRIFSVIKGIAVPILQNAVEFIKGILNKLKQFWDENGAQIIEAVKNVWSGIAAIFEFISPVIKFIVETLWSNVKGVISGALDIIMGLVKVFAGLFTGDWSKMWEGIKQLLGGALETAWNLINLLMFGKILGGIKAFVTKGGEFFAGLGPKIWEVVKNLDTYLWNFITSMFSKLVGLFKGFVDDGVRIFGTLRTFGASIFESLWAAIRTVASNIASGVVGFFRGMFTGAKNHFEGLLSSARSIFNSIKTAITSPIETAKSVVSRAIDAIKGFFSNMRVKIPLPHFSFSVSHKDIAGISIPVPKVGVDWYDKGGVFYGPQVIGVGEKRPEFVGALDDLRKIVREETKSNQMVIPQGNVEIPLIIDGYEFTRLIIPFIDLLQGSKLTSELRLRGVK